ncbi:MAG: hypothetical protein Q7U22_06070 [Pararhizobium sp.]|nr:hypothetical protein [Pararhizobium sp.]
MRIHYGQGYRIFYTIVGQKIVLLLTGSTKQDQAKVITKAKKTTWQIINEWHDHDCSERTI